MTVPAAFGDDASYGAAGVGRAARRPTVGFVDGYGVRFWHPFPPWTVPESRSLPLRLTTGGALKHRVYGSHHRAGTGYPGLMTDVVDADELLRRILRGRDRAAEERARWADRARDLAATEPDGARDAAASARAYEAVLRVLDEIVRPGARPVEHPTADDGVRRVT